MAPISFPDEIVGNVVGPKGEDVFEVREVGVELENFFKLSLI